MALTMNTHADRSRKHVLPACRQDLCFLGGSGVGL